MEYTQSDQPNNESWSSPAEYKQRQLKNKRIPIGSEQKTEPTDSGIMHEATIWERPEVTPKPTQYHTEVPKPHPPVEQPKRKPTMQPIEQLTPKESPMPPSADALREAVHNAFAVTPQEHQRPASEIAVRPIEDMKEQAQLSPQNPENDSAWVDTFAETPSYNGNPDFPTQPQRPYFWTDPEIHSPLQAPIAHDVLPPVLPVSVSQGQPIETGLRTGTQQEDPAFAEAINPNFGSESPRLPAVGPQTSETMIPAVQVQPKASEGWKLLTNRVTSLARRSPASAVKSQSMQYPTFEQAPMPMESLDGAMPETPIDYPVPFSRSPENSFRDDSAHAELNGFETAPQTTAEAKSQEHTRQVEVELSRTILIDGMSVYDMFIDKQIDSEGLHHIVTEYTQGGDIKKIALQEIARQQIRFERDPQMRQTPIVAQAPQQDMALVQQPIMAQTPPNPTMDRTERLAELTQGASEKMQGFIQSPHLGTVGSVLAIVAIYTAIIIIIIA